MNIIQYNHKTMEAQVVDLWNECCFFDPITVQKFRKQALFDDNFDNELCYVAADNDLVIGFILGTKRKFPYLERGMEEDQGWINVMFVKKEYRRQGIGQALLTLIENKLIEKGVKRITLAAYSPGYFFAGLDPENYPESILFFEKNQYRSFEKHYSMGRDLHGYVISEKTKLKKEMAEEKGYRFLPFQNEYSLELLDFLRREFGGGWKWRALNALRQNKGEDRLFLVLNPKGEICGCANRAIDENEMRFGPVGIAESERNNGLGGILLECVLYEMAKKGIYRMFFVTTDDPGRRYYERHGLKVIRTFVTYRKEIN